MSVRRTEIQKLKEGNYIMSEEGEPCLIKGTEKSKPGKHGHAKIRIICVGMFDKNKRSIAYPSGTMVETPEIEKGNAQINFIEDKTVNIMDLTTYESLDVAWPSDADSVKKLNEIRNNPASMSTFQVEYWKIVGKTLINRIYGA